MIAGNIEYVTIIAGFQPNPVNRGKNRPQIIEISIKSRFQAGKPGLHRAKTLWMRIYKVSNFRPTDYMH